MTSPAPPTGEMVDHALEYAGYYGWRVIPLRPKSKRPFHNGWQNLATDDEDTIIEWWDENPAYNVGVKLGPDSNLIDIEIDGQTDEEVASAEARLIEIFGGELPDTPTYISRRGKHRLFKYTPDLMLRDSGVFKIHNKTIEIRTGHPERGLQSAMPPSIHPETGDSYRWLRSPRSCEVAEIPQSVIARLVLIATEGDSAWSANGKHIAGGSSTAAASTGRDWDDILKGVGAGERNSSAAALAGKWLNDIADPFDNSQCQTVYQWLQTWNRQNDPPLDERELNTVWRSILTRHRQNLANKIEDSAIAETNSRHRDPGVTGTGSKMQWRLVRVESEPVKWKLFSPWWETKAQGGYILLSSYQMQSWSRIATAALEQASVWISHSTFKVMWHGNPKAKDKQLKDGLAARLIESCEVEQAEPEEVRSLVVAQYVWDCLGMARSRVLEEPDDKGRPTMLEDGRIVVKFQTLLSLLQQNVDPPNQGELLKLFKDIGVGTAKLFRVAGGRYRFHVFGKPEQDMLENMVIAGGEHE